MWTRQTCSLSLQTWGFKDFLCVGPLSTATTRQTQRLVIKRRTIPLGLVKNQDSTISSLIDWLIDWTSLFRHFWQSMHWNSHFGQNRLCMNTYMTHLIVMYYQCVFPMIYFVLYEMILKVSAKQITMESTNHMYVTWNLNGMIKCAYFIFCNIYINFPKTMQRMYNFGMLPW